jgi:tubulin polyglutamylase TTLL1
MSNRGNGITVCKQISDIKKIVCNRQRHDNGKFKTYIVQEYLCRPFLYHKRKFDIRHYMLISSINGIIKGYWYEEGYLRTTSYEYSLGELHSSVHLTNDAVQKYCKEYGKFEKGNKVSYKEFQDYLDGKFGKGTYDF